VRLLLDQNLSDRLIRILDDHYPGSVHVRDVGLASADDAAVWGFASERGLAIVSKDSDFHQRSLLFGPPPKVIWLRIGNCTTDAVADLLRHRHLEVAAFAGDQEAAFLALS
jgi:predicted nuclease of predicted toxin-antitoxin system